MGRPRPPSATPIAWCATRTPARTTRWPSACPRCGRDGPRRVSAQRAPRGWLQHLVGVGELLSARRDLRHRHPERGRDALHRAPRRIGTPVLEVRDRRDVHVSGVRELLLLEPALVAQLPDRPPESFLRFVPATHATTLASTSSLCL